MRNSKFTGVILFVALSLITILWLVSSKSSAAQPLDNSASGFSAEKAYEHVKQLVQKIGPRPAGSKSELKAAQYIAYILRQNGWKVKEQPFSKVVVREASVLQKEQQVELISSQNIIAELPGTSPDTVIMGAHYDSAGVNAPGAVDNASGVGVLLELARVLSQESHQETYQFIFFGAEEYGLVGSQFFTAQADLSAVRWMLNLDMVGSPLEIDGAGKRSAPPELVKQVALLAGQSQIPFHISRDFILMTRESSQGGSSDYSSFLDKGIPAIGLGIYGRPEGYFHRPEDRLDRVSLEAIQQLGDFTHRLLKTVKLESLGPEQWDDHYLPFQVGNYVFILPNYGIRAFTILTILLSILMLIRFYRRSPGQKTDWKKAPAVLGIIGTALLLGVIVLLVSSAGEEVWSWLKQTDSLYYAHPLVFVMARLGIACGAFILLAPWLPKLPLAREPQLYWVTGVICLLGISLVLAVIRIDLAFPFVFWLLCYNLQFFLPSLILALIGPYFLIRMHFELFNSSQWISYYQAVHDYFPVFLGIYSLLLVPFVLAILYAGMRKAHYLKKWLKLSQKPALAGILLLILSLGLVPVYSLNYPQTIIVQEEWSGTAEGKVHVFSEEGLPKKIVSDLSGEQGKSIYVPILNEKPPLEVKAAMAETTKNEQRNLAISILFNYSREPYLTRLRLESDKPFAVHTDEFLPMAKLPRKLQLIGVQNPGGKYSIILQRTPPQKNSIQLAVETKGVITCSVEGLFADPSPRLQIQYPLSSIDYQVWYRESFEF